LHKARIDPSYKRCYYRTKARRAMSAWKRWLRDAVDDQLNATKRRCRYKDPKIFITACFVTETHVTPGGGTTRAQQCEAIANWPCTEVQLHFCTNNATAVMSQPPDQALRCVRPNWCHQMLMLSLWIVLVTTHQCHGDIMSLASTTKLDGHIRLLMRHEM